MILLFLLECFKTYLPLLYGVYLCVNKQTSNKLSIQKLIKFAVIRVILSLFQHIIVDLVNFNEYPAQFLMLSIFVYLTLYNYAYAEAVYNILVAPFMNIFSQMVTNVVNDMNNHKRRLNLVKAMEQQKDKKSNQAIRIEPIGFFKKFIYNAFNDPLTFSENDKKS